MAVRGKRHNKHPNVLQVTDDLTWEYPTRVLIDINCNSVKGDGLGGGYER